MNYYINYNSTTGQIITRYVSGIHDLTIASPPAGTANLAVTQAEFQLTIDVAGYTVNNGILVAPPAPTAAQLLATAQAAQVAILQADFQAAMALPVPFTNSAGVTSSYPNMDTVSFNGKTAMQNLEAVINSGAAAWTFKYWLDVNGVAQVFTFADVQGLAAVMSAQDTPSELNLVSKIGQVQKATTVSAVQKIIF